MTKQSLEDGLFGLFRPFLLSRQEKASGHCEELFFLSLQAKQSQFISNVDCHASQGSARNDSFLPDA